MDGHVGAFSSSSSSELCNHVWAHSYTVVICIFLVSSVILNLLVTYVKQKELFLVILKWLQAADLFSVPLSQRMPGLAFSIPQQN